MSLTSAVSASAPRARGELRQRVEQRRADALPRKFGIDIKHVDLVAALEAGEAGDLAVDDGDSVSAPGKRAPKAVFVVGRAAQASHWSSS